MRPVLAALAAAVIVVLAAAVTAGTAHAVERPCPEGQFWDLNRGACVKKKKVRKRSPEDKYYAALEHLDGRAKNPDPAKAVDLLDEACRARLGVACTQLAFVHLRGRGGVTADPKQAITYYEQACTFGDLDGCVGAAEMWSSGVLGQIQHDRAVPVLDKACKAGSGRACHALAQKYDWALGVKGDATKASELYTKAFGMLVTECDKGAGASCALVGVLYRDGSGVPQDVAKAVAALDKGCTSGSGDACYNLGFLAEGGTGMAADARRAWGLFDRACSRYDHADGCFKAGAMLALDQVPGGDLSVLPGLANRACELSQFRCDLLGYILGDGIGVKVDLAASLRWYDLACSHGNGVACRVMGQRHEHGRGTAANVKRAVEYFEKACELQEWIGCAWAGMAHFRGDTASGLASSPARAYQLLEIGCERSDHESCQWAGELLTNGTDGTDVKKPEQGVVFFQEGCRLGRGQSCAWAGLLHEDGRATGAANVPRAAELYQQACWATELPDTWACRKVAELHGAASTGAVGKDLLLAARALIVACRIDGGTDCTSADDALRAAGADDAAKQELVAAMEAACNATPRNEPACNNHALLYRSGGYATGKDFKEAARRFGESCERGNDHACWLWGEMYQFGQGFVANPERAREIYTRSCDRGFVQTCYALGALLRETGKEKEALALYWKSCEDGHASACNSVGFAYYTAQGMEWNVAEAGKFYEKACELGEAVGCSNVGELYEFGITRARDAAKAYELYAKACDMGFGGACARAARFIARGEGGATKDVDQAEALYARGCDEGSPEACRDLAALLAAGKKTSASRIAQLNQRAFDGAKAQAEGNPYYAWVLGTFHRDGVATVKDATAAAAQFVRACEGYDPLGCLDAGRMYLAGGEGLDRDPERAAVHLDKACAASVDEACTLAQTAREGGASGGVPLQPGKGSGCACDGGGAPDGGGLVVLAALGYGWARRRRAQVTRG